MRGHGREADEAPRMLPDQLGQAIVGERRQLAGGIGVEHLDAGRGEGGDRHVDAVLVHLPDPPLVVEQAVEEVHVPVAGLIVIDALHQSEVGAVGGEVAADLLQLPGHLGDRPSLFRGDLPELAGHGRPPDFALAPAYARRRGAGKPPRPRRSGADRETRGRSRPGPWPCTPTTKPC